MPGPSELDMEIVARSFHVISDGTVFDDLVESWYRKLFADTDAAARPKAARAFEQHYEVLQDLLRRAAPPRRLDEIDRMINSIRRPAIIVTQNLRVLAANPSGCALFGTRPGSIADRERLGANVASAIARADSWQSAPSGPIALTIGETEATADQLIEIRPLNARDGNSAALIVSSISLQWHERVAQILEESFGMTEAETGVCRLLLEGCDIKEISRRRKTSAGTTRNQMQAVLGKTGAGSQVGLVRLLSMISNHVGSDTLTAHEGWSDPYGREKIFVREDGYDVAYSWIGARDGRPAMLLHAIGVGYLFPHAFEAMLKRRGIRLYVPHRPGCGSAPRRSSIPFVEDFSASIGALARRLKLSRVPVLAIHGSANVALHMAAGRDNPFSSILAVRGAFIDYERLSESMDMPRSYRLVHWASRHAPWLAEAITDLGYRQLQENGCEWFFSTSLADQPFDRATTLQADLAPLMRNACSLAFARDARSVLDEMSLRGLFTPDLVKRAGIPIRWLYGRESIAQFVRPGEENQALRLIEEVLRDNPSIELEWVENAGDFMPYQVPEFVAEELAAMP